MKESPENLRRGNYIVITRHREYHDDPEAIVLYNGAPVRIVTIQLPFIGIEHLCNKVRDTIDMRVFDVMKVNKQYAMALSNIGKIQQEQGLCPECGESLTNIQLQNARVYKCSNCGFQGATQA